MAKEKIADYGWELLKLVASALLGFLFAYISFSKQFDANEKGKLTDRLNKVLEINFLYPYVDNQEFISKWAKNKESSSDSALRYDNYCIFIFNFAQDVCEYFAYDKKMIATFIDLKDLLGNHKEWWALPEQQDTESYPKQFKAFINGILKE